MSVAVLEKGSAPGAHILSGAVMVPVALNDLFPNWQELGAPLKQPVTGDDVLFLSETAARRTPDFLVPDCFHNEGNHVTSLGALTQWLGEQAEGLGVEIFPGFTAAEVLATSTVRSRAWPPATSALARTARRPLRKGEKLRDKIEEQLAKLQQMPHMIRSFFKAPSVAYILDC